MQELLERIRLNIYKTPLEYEGVQMTISASFSVASVTSSGELDATISQADDALYKAKNEGRNRVDFYQSS